MIKLKKGDIVRVINVVSIDSRDMQGKIVKIEEVKNLEKPYSFCGKKRKFYYMVEGGFGGLWDDEVIKLDVGIDKHGRYVDINGVVIKNK